MRRSLFYLILLLILATPACCGLGELPIPPEDTEIPSTEPPSPPPLSPPPPSLPTATPSGQDPMPTPETEERIAEVEWPVAMRTGDNEVIRFSLLPAPDGGYVAEPELPDHQVEPTPLPLVVARPGYTAYAVASLSAAGLQVQEASPARQRLLLGQANTWRWTVYPPEAGTYRAVVNLVVEWEPEADSGLPSPFQESVWSRILTLEAHSTFTLTGKQTDWVGTAGSVVGFVAGLPFTKKAFETLWKRLKRSRSKTAPRKAPVKK